MKDSTRRSKTPSSSPVARESGIGVSSIASAMFALPLVSLGLIAILLQETQLLQGYFVLSLVLLLLSSLLCQKTDAIISLAGRLRCRSDLAFATERAPDGSSD